MPRPPLGRDRLLRVLLGSTVRHFPIPPAYRDANRSLYELSKRTGTAFSWVHRTVRQFEDEGWVRRAPDGFVIDQPPALFAWWKKHRTPPKVHSLFLANPLLAVPALSAKGIPAAFTTYYAENAVQGHLFPHRGDIYVPAQSLKKALAVLTEDLDGLIGGTNLKLRLDYDSILQESIEYGKGPTALRVVPLPQLILDLLTEGASAGEAAEMLIARAYPHAHPRLQ